MKVARKKAVLIADDEHICLVIASKMVEKTGRRALCARDGIEALQLYSKHCHEISHVILDVHMPRLDGVETFRRLKTLNRDVRVIILSGYLTEKEKELLDRLGPEGYIAKPLYPDSLRPYLQPVLPA